jgi:hypothetical protein
MRKIVSVERVVKVVAGIWAGSMHKKRMLSVGMFVWGIMLSRRLSSATIGRSLAKGRKKSAKHGIKQIDRLLGNDKLDVSKELPAYVRWVVSSRNAIVVSLDWTSFDADGHSCIVVNLVTRHGRATPLVWITVKNSCLKRRRNCYEREALCLLSRCLPTGVGVTVLADRGFADTKFFMFITHELQWDYVIRIRENTYVSTKKMKRRKIREMTALHGRILELREAALTAKEVMAGAVVTVKARGMKEAWHLATSLQGQKRRVVKLYGRRFTCEEHFRDTKDDRYGMGLKETRVSTPERRDRFLLFHAIAAVLLSLLGAAGEALGLDRHLRANTLAKRTHSLYCQGREYLQGAVQEYGGKIRSYFESLLSEHKTVTEMYWLV